MAHAEVEERQLLKAMTWWDGFVVALANPGFLIAALGASIGVLGTTGAFVLWTISVASARCRTTSTPRWRRCSRKSPAASRCTRTRRGASTSPSSARSPPSATGSPGRSCSPSTGSSSARWSRPSGSPTRPSTKTRRRLPPLAAGPHRHRLHHRRLALQHLRRAAGRVARLRHRRPAVHPRLRADVPPVPHRRLVQRQHDRGRSARAAASRSRSPGCTSCAGRPTGSRPSRRSRPSTTTPSTTRRRRCAPRRCSPVAVYALLPLGLGGTLGTEADRQRRDAHRVLHPGVRRARRQRARQRA